MGEHGQTKSEKASGPMSGFMGCLKLANSHHLERGFFVERLAFAATQLAQKVFLEPDLGRVNPFAGCRPVHFARRNLRPSGFTGARIVETANVADPALNARIADQFQWVLIGMEALGPTTKIKDVTILISSELGFYQGQPISGVMTCAHLPDECPIVLYKTTLEFTQNYLIGALVEPGAPDSRSFPAWPF